MIAENLGKVRSTVNEGVKLVAVSKFHPAEELMQAYEAGQRVFGENRPQELCAKAESLPKDIEWHFIGHLQTNKLKMVLPYASLVQSVDSVHLLSEINKWGKANGKVINVLLEMHIAAEETKQGLYEEEVLDIMFDASKYSNICFCGLMGMASHTSNMEDVRADFLRIKAHFDYLRDLFPDYTEFKELSIGMSDDYAVAMECGATIVRIGTAIFGPREY